MSFRFMPLARKIHLWIGLALLPVMIVLATTGILINHKKRFVLDRPFKTAAGSKPAKQAHAMPPWSNAAETRPTVDALERALADSRRQWGSVALERIEVKNDRHHGLLIKVKAAEETSAEPRELVWRLEQGVPNPLPSAPQGGRSWGSVLTDLHTGKLFHEGHGWLWADIGGVALIVASLTGLVLGWKWIKPRGAARRRVESAEKGPGHVAES
jgi:hypothetical protein